MKILRVSCKVLFLKNSLFNLFLLISEFITWKSHEERENKVGYCKVRGTKRTGETEKYYFECVRSSLNHSLKDNRKRAIKSQGSCKMSFSCSSQIIVSRNSESGRCIVTYYKTHYGHEQDIQHLHLSKIDKNAIASKLILGVPPKRYKYKFLINLHFTIYR